MTALRPHAEDQYAEELALLATTDDRPRPTGWRLSPQAVVTYLLGDGAKITPKYVGPRRLMEVAVSLLVTDRALLRSSVNFVPRTGSDFAMGDFVDVDVAEMEYVVSDSGNTSIFVGKTMPQINVMTAGISMKTAIGIGVLLASLTLTSETVRDALGDSMQSVRAAWSGI